MQYGTSAEHDIQVLQWRSPREGHPYEGLPEARPTCQFDLQDPHSILDD